ncbi:MAG: F0F1 ATP synthase subunit delta [Gammaproteobacteria bacterium]
MAEKTTVARPYAQALFDLARTQPEGLKAWSQMLHSAASVVADPQVQALIGDPRISKEQLASLVLGVSGDLLNGAAQNFIKLLVENRRLDVLPEIVALYEVQRAEAENTTVAEIVSAYPLTDEQQRKIAGALQKRLGRTISLRNTVDKELLGGAVIRAGDTVIDGSARGQLERLANVLVR